MLEFGGRTFEEKVDFTLLQKWLRTCEHTHLLCQPQKWHSSLKPPPRLRLIDVQDMCLVDASPSHRYVSLSYVWGSVLTFQTKKNILSELYLPGGLHAFKDDIALTVQDAMRVVRGLRERYLWTDAICIVQDDPVDKAELVQEMDTVYARAILTIVAAEGIHANAGLPGVRSHSRDVPKVFDIGNDISLLQARAPLAETLLNCPWSKRAWTYQEGILSSRQLIFTTSTVHYVCCS
ncbi:HET-domain-containing protein, partial [Pyrenochaeta sp. DS3sAY3a]